MALHLTAQPHPSMTAAARRHHGTAAHESFGRPARPGWEGSSPFSISRSQRARRASRSTTMHANAASTKNMTKMSRIAVRDRTKCMPSSAMSRPAAQPSTVERNIRRAVRVRMSTETTPNDGRHEPPAERVVAERNTDY